MAVTAAQLNVIVSATGAKEVIADLNSIDGQVKKTASGFDAFYDSIGGGMGNALRALDGVARVMGSIALIGGVSLITGGAKAAWDQVSAVEQATVALRAYESDADAVNTVLSDLIDYARSDLGVLFQRQDLFRAAQGLKMYGAETRNLTRYVEIMSRSVGLGLSTWDDLNRVIGRVGSTGRLAGDDFDYLRAAGFRLDDSLRNTNITFEELFAAMDRGIPANALEGQADTIRGALIRLQTGIRNIGLAFLDVDSETSKFVEGGLGDKLRTALFDARGWVDNFTDVAGTIGDALASGIEALESMAAAYRSLPGWMQGAIETVLKAVTAFGMLRVATSSLGAVMNLAGLGGMIGRVTALSGAFSAAGGGAMGLRAGLTALVAGINPVALAFTGVAAVVGVAAVAWGRHKRETEAAQTALASVGETALEVQDIVNNMRLDGGDLQLAARIEEMNMYTTGVLERIQMVNEQRLDWNAILGLAFTDGNSAAGDAVREFLDTGIGQAFIQWADENDKLGADVINTLMSGTGPELFQVMAGIQPILNEFYDQFDVPPAVQQRIAENQASLFEMMTKPMVDSEQVFKDWNEARKLYLEDPFEPDLAGYDAWLSGYIDGLPQATANMQTAQSAIDGLTASQRSFNLEMAQMRIDGDGQMADTLVRLNDLFGENSRATGVAAEYVEFFQSNVTAGNFALDDYAGSIEQLNWLYDQGLISQSAYDRMMVGLTISATQNAIAMEDASDGVGALAHELGTSLIPIAEETVENFEALQKAIVENREAMLSIAGFGDPLSQWNLSGHASDMSLLAMNTQQAATALADTFRVIVGNTDAIAKQVESVKTWADELINVAGEYGLIDDLLRDGLITQEQYNAAQLAYNTIAEDTARIQNDVLTIQAKQAPLIAEQTSALADYMDRIAGLPAQQQLVALGWMDAATAARAMEMQTLAIAAATGQLGVQGQNAFARMIAGAIALSPELAAVLDDMGLISLGADGTFTIHWEGLEEGMSDFDRLSVMFLEFMNLVSDEPITFEMLGLEDPRRELDGMRDVIYDIDGTEIGIGVAIDEEGGPGGIEAGVNNLVTGISNNVPTIMVPVQIQTPSMASAGSSAGRAVAGALGDLAADVTITVAADTSVADERLSAVYDSVSALRDLEPSITVEADALQANTELDTLTVRLYGFDGLISTTTLEADASQANSALDNLSERLSGYRNLVSTTTLEADADQANTALDNLASRLSGYRNLVSTTTLRANPDQANTELDNLASRLSGYRDLVSTTTLDADSSSAHEVLRLLEDRLGQINGSSATVYLYAIDFATSTINSVSRNLRDLDGRTATTYTDSITRYSSQGIRGYADGGIVRDPLVLVGERGPELVSLPYGSRVHSNDESMRMARDIVASAYRNEHVGATASTTGARGGTQVINNYYQQDVKVMTSAEWEAYKQKSDRGNQAYNHLSDPDAYNYGGNV